MFDLFEAASKNGDSLESLFKSSLDSLIQNDARLLDEFSEWVKAQALVSINTKLYVITELLSGRSYQNIYDWAAENARLSDRPVEDLLRERLGPFYEKRMAFDRELHGSENFRYGALNAGGLGATDYDPYCLVLKSRFQQSLQNVACIAGDSLEICFSPNGVFDGSNFVSRVALPMHWHLLVANERIGEVFLVEQSQWPGIVISPGRYFEVIFIGDVTADEIDSIRVSRKEYNSQWELAFLNLTSRRNQAERALVNDFLELRRAEVAGRVKVEVLG